MLIVVAISIIASFLVATRTKQFYGFTMFFIINLFWIGYGIKQQDMNIIIQFCCFLFTSVLGMHNTLERKDEKI